MVMLWKRIYEAEKKRKEEEGERRKRVMERLERRKAEENKSPPKQDLGDTRNETRVPPVSDKRSAFGTHNDIGKTAKSMDTIPKSVDKAMGKPSAKNDHVKPGISVRYGPVDDMDVDGPATNGASNGTLNAKRKSRSSIGNSKSYKEASSESEDDRPLVRPVENTFD